MSNKKPALVSLSLMYAIALVTCFICNLATSHSLSWFYIVLASVGVAFSVTCLPMILKHFRVVISALAAIVCTGALLFVCNIYTQGTWLIMAYKIAALPMVLLLGFLLIATIKGLNWYTKSALMSLLGAVTAVTVNPWVDAVLSGDIGNYFNLFLVQFQPTGNGYFVNLIIAAGFCVYFVIGMVMGVLTSIRRKSRA